MSATLPLSSPSPLPLPPKNPKNPRSIQASDSQDPINALLHYLHVVSRGRSPAKIVFISAMKACSLRAAKAGQSLHAHIVKSGFAPDRFVASSIVAFYSSCGRLGFARQVFDAVPVKDAVLQTAMLMSYVDNGELAVARRFFDEMNERDVVAWNAMLSGYIRHGLPEEALELLRDMQITMLRPNEVTLVCALSACSQMGSLALGEWLHGYIDKHLGASGKSPTLGNCLVHMYAKCGRLDIAFGLFVQQKPKNLESWNTMLTAFALHGCGMSALSLFSQMIKLGIWPDRITFLGVLMACSHTGRVDHALQCFNFMTRVYGVEPNADHCGCMVDVLARKGLLKEAREVIKSIAFETDASIWGALLVGCFTYADYDLGLEAATHLVELEPWEEGRYVALSKLYEKVGRIEEAMRVRKAMDEACTERSAGRSVIEVDGVVHEFIAGDRSHYRSKEIYSMIEILCLNFELVDQHDEAMYALMSSEHWEGLRPLISLLINKYI
ncbi:pentatricopeptide repeat-containing protein ELI1, chloroplastic-like isoform X1 [Ananas comosus]|uniref:Pentatricopeptide repeat-containing protein ELI1, chloroplastic-like isoform X1 n=1 Tax=Ananas comosus TaxID=4615 RepID=A0A6P5H7W3_ANACO|nr:pentatricopeptide repeat-containing protein ELI1, chloroplastic-like isoform X1 [Ananas comosus]